MSTTPTFERSMDRYIFKAIRRHTPEEPQTLTGIVAAVDAMGRLLISHDELAGGLQRLVAAGYVAETDKHRFHDATGDDRGGEARAFSGLTEAEHDTAVEEYRAAFQKLCDQWDDEDEDGFAERMLVVRWATPGGRYCTDEDEDAAERLADALEPIIGESGLGEINGFELSTGEVGILVFGRGGDADVDAIYELIAPVVRAHDRPPGSSIIRCYSEERGDVESDVVA